MVRKNFRIVKYASWWMQMNKGWYLADLSEVWFRAFHKCQKVTWSSPNGLWETCYHPPWLCSWDEEQTSLVVFLKYSLHKIQRLHKRIPPKNMKVIFKEWQFSITQSATQRKKYSQIIFFVCISLGNNPVTIIFMSFNTKTLLNPTANDVFLLSYPFMLT